MIKFFRRIFQGNWEYEASFLILFGLTIIQFLEMVLHRENNSFFDFELFGFPVIFILMLSPVSFFAYFLYRNLLKPSFGVKFLYRMFLKKLFFICLKWLFLYLLFYFFLILFMSIENMINLQSGAWSNFFSNLFFLEFLVLSIAFFILLFVSGAEMISLSIKNFRFLPIGIVLTVIPWHLIPILLND